MGPKRPVTDVWGDRIEKETIRGRNDVFVARFARLKKTGKKTPVYRDTQRDWFSKYSHEIFRNIHLEYIQSDNDKNGRNNNNGRSLLSGSYRKEYNNIKSKFLTYVYP